MCTNIDKGVYGELSVGGQFHLCQLGALSIAGAANYPHIHSYGVPGSNSSPWKSGVYSRTLSSWSYTRIPLPGSNIAH